VLKKTGFCSVFFRKGQRWHKRSRKAGLLDSSTGLYGVPSGTSYFAKNPEVARELPSSATSGQEISRFFA
jgi:hypothetical protein